MTTYALIRDGAVVSYPYSFAMLRADNPQISFPRDPDDAKLAEYGVIALANGVVPEHDPVTQDIVEGSPAIVGGVWTRVWSAVAASASEIAARQADAADAAAFSDIVADSFVPQFIAMTPAQVRTYIANNTDNLTQCRAVLEKVCLMLLLLARREFRQ